MDLVFVQGLNILQSSNATSDVSQPTKEHDTHSFTEQEILSNYADLFRGLGIKEGKLHLDVDNSVVPCIGDAKPSCPNRNKS